MTKNPWTLVEHMTGAIGAMAMAYRMGKEQPMTREELESEHNALVESHKHANRALTNMAIQLSGVMDECRDLSREARLTEIAHVAEVEALKKQRADTERELDRIRSSHSNLVAENMKLGTENAELKNRLAAKEAP